MKLIMRQGRFVLQELGGNVRKWIDFVALLLLSSVGVIASFLVKRNIPIADDLTLLLFGTAIISSVILIRTELPFDEEQVRNHSDTEGLDATVLSRS